MAYLVDLGCLGTALMRLLGGEVAFKVLDGFEVVLRDELILVLANWKGLGGGAGALRDPIDSNRSFPVMSTLKKVLAAFEIFRHMLDLNLTCPVWRLGSIPVAGRVVLPH